MLLRQLVFRACSRAWAKTGKRIAARMAMMAMTTSNSIRVKPFRLRIRVEDMVILPANSGQDASAACKDKEKKGAGRFYTGSVDDLVHLLFCQMLQIFGKMALHDPLRRGSVFIEKRAVD